MNYVGRFAPSPTGPLHYGSLVAALASYLDARHAGGKWLLRIEDLDPPRESADAPAQIITQLLAFGLHWDGEILYQSTRLKAYEHALASIDAFTFRCTCSRKSTPRVYPGTCREKPGQEGPYAIRFRVPDQTVSIIDEFIGLQSWHLKNDVGDFIIRRKDGLHAYQLAVVVDDIYQSVDHVVRGNDLLDSTPRQLALLTALEGPVPVYMHLPVLVDRSGSKLSKQSQAKPVNLNEPMPTIRSALTDLGQNSHPLASSVEEILGKATLAWDPSTIPAVREIQARDEYLRN